MRTTWVCGVAAALAVRSAGALRVSGIGRSARSLATRGFPLHNAASTLDKVESEVAKAVESLVDESCDVSIETISPECADPQLMASMRQRLHGLMSSTVRGASPAAGDLGGETASGEALEEGWESQGKKSSLRRNIEVWRKLASCAYKVLKARKLGAEAKTEAAVFARDSLLTLGPTFVKLGQVLSTRTDVLPAEYIEVLKSLQDDVPAFAGKRAVELVKSELNLTDLSEVFSTFDETPIAAASLGQVHIGTLKATGAKVAVKVQRAGLRELFDVDLKNLRKLCELLDSLDPKSDGADRSYIEVFDESEKLLYLEIDYENEARNADRFRADFATDTMVRVPEMYYELSTPRVLTMEYIDAFKLTDVARVEREGLNRKQIATRTAESFLYQVIDTGYFHCDPHPGNLQVDTEGRLVYYDFGMMDELKPNVRAGFKEFCFALFDGGPLISEITLGLKAKQLVDAVELMGVLAKGADRLSCEKLARYFIRAFKDAQLGKKSDGPGIKSTLGAELQALTEAQVFRFPSTFTFIFRAIASIDGIGKGLDSTYDLGKLAQPFVERLLDKDKYGGSDFRKKLGIFGMATGLNANDIETAVTTPRKIAYLEETIRSMEQGSLKIRVRSLENEMALSRLSAQSKVTTSLLSATLLLSVADRLVFIARAPAVVAVALAGACGLRGLMALGAIVMADKKAAKYASKQFN